MSLFSLFRSKNDVRLPRWPDGDPGSHHRLTRAQEHKRRRMIQALLVLSIVVNVFLVYSGMHPKTITTIVTVTPEPWPDPLDNYQTLNTHPVVGDDSSTQLVNQHDHAIVTSLYTDAFASAVATLGHTLNRANSSAARLLFHTRGNVSARALCIASAAGWDPIEVERIPPPHDGVHPHFLDQYSKLHLWTLDRLGYKSVLYLDADTLVRRKFDELFHLPYAFGAVQDVYVDAPGFVTAFNAGVLFLRPDSALFDDMVHKIGTANYPAWQAEQSFLNHYFGTEAVRLPYAYNANLAIKLRAQTMWAGMQHEMRIMHYTLVKPFLQGDYEEVPLDELEQNVQRDADRHPEFKEEIGEWLEAWKETRRTYGAKLRRCQTL